MVNRVQQVWVVVHTSRPTKPVSLRMLGLRMDERVNG
jgi:hypothetical protein